MRDPAVRLIVANHAFAGGPYRNTVSAGSIDSRAHPASASKVSAIVILLVHIEARARMLPPSIRKSLLKLTARSSSSVGDWDDDG